MHFSKFTDKKESEVLQTLSANLDGLSETEASERLKKDGPNTLDAREITWLDILIRQIKSPFIYLLIAASGVSFLLGETLDGILIMAFVIINSLIGFYQEYQSYRSLKLLEKYISYKAKVLRNGKEIFIEPKDLVAGDIVRLVAGDIIQADVRFLKSQNLTVDESVLTGESKPAEKNSDPTTKPAKNVYEAENIGFSATNVLTGQALGVVVATGKNTQIGQIATLVSETETPGSFEKGIANLSKFILRLILLTLLIVFITNFVLKGVTTDPGHLKDLAFSLIVFSIALAVSVIPEALPVVTTFSLARGAVRLTKKHVVVRRLSAIEDLGSVEILCSDKTGTLTENKLKLKEIYPTKAMDDLAFAFLGSEKSVSEPFTYAIYEALSENQKRQANSYQRLSEIPFDPKRKRNTVIVGSKGGKEFLLLCRGAPETILQLCKNVGRPGKYKKWIAKQGSLGRRTIAIAKKKLPSPDQSKFDSLEKNLNLIGLLSFEDPLKPSAPAAIELAKQLGIDIKIITGDGPEVAGTVAQKVGLVQNSSMVVKADEFEKLSHEEKHKVVEQNHVFARITPELKHEIVRLLGKNHEVGFLGEGINDAPALKAANVGLVVEGASDIAKDSSDIILLRRDLKVIIDGIAEGRKVFSNTTKYIKATLASNFGNFFAVASASLLISFLPLLPIQILLLNLLSDFPMIAIATDSVDEEDLKKPKTYNVKEIALIAIIFGVVSTIDDFLFFALFYRISPEVLRTNWFMGSILTELIFIFSIRTRLIFFKAKKPSKVILLSSVVAAVATVSLPFIGGISKALGFVKPTIDHMLVIFFLVGVYFVATEVVKFFYYKIFNPTS